MAVTIGADQFSAAQAVPGVGRLLGQVRRAVCLSQAQASSLALVSLPTWARLERGAHTPRMATLMSALWVLRLRVNALKRLAGDDGPPRVYVEPMMFDGEPTDHRDRRVTSVLRDRLARGAPRWACHQRRSQGLTQQSAARLIGMPRPTLSRFERSSQDIGFDVWLSVSRAYGFDVVIQRS